MSTLNNGKPDRKTGPNPKFEKQTDTLSENGLLSATEKEDLRSQAKQIVYQEMKKREEDLLLAQYIKEIRQESVPEEMLVPIWLQLAPIHGEYILLDNKRYYNEFGPYWVTPVVFSTLIEIQSRGWNHEDETEVRDMASKHRAVRFRPAHVGGQNFSENPLGKENRRELRISAGQLMRSTPETILGIR
jgi:hypothetical protein